MRTPTSIRDDISADDLRRAAKGSDDVVARRFLAIAHVLDGMSGREAARKARASRSMMTKWIRVLNAEGIEGLGARPTSGAAEPIREGISADDLRQAAEGLNDRAARRFLAIAHVLDGMSHTEAARKVGASSSAFCGWVQWFNASKGALN